jgi:hypothetical protein
MNLTALNLPRAPLRLSRKNEVISVFCVVRKKNLVLTPEEWVRQHIIHYLIHQLETPVGLISSEAGIKVNTLDRRCDILVYGNDKKVKVLVECKAPDISIKEKVLHQITQYNSKIQADYLWLSNGIHHKFYLINKAENKLVELEGLPKYSEM